MTLSLNDLRIIYPQQLWLELSTPEREYAWKLAASQPYSNVTARRTAFVNCLCLNALLTWLKEEPDLQEMPEVWPQSSELPSFWDVMNGTGLTLGETRLVIIPSDKSNLEEFRISQEWVDIPNWAAHYYLAVQLNLEEKWLRVWGYATHQQIREAASYDPMDRTYSLDREVLIEDLNVMWVARELCHLRKPDVKPLPTLSPAQVEKLLEQLGQWTPYSPRLVVPFEQWAALVASDSSRQHLYQRRLENQKKHSLQDSYATLPFENAYSEAADFTNTEWKTGTPSLPVRVSSGVPEGLRPTPIDSPTVAAAEGSHSLANNLSQWFHNIFEAGWQSIEALSTPQQRTLAIQFRSDVALNEVRVKGAKLIDLGMQLGGTAVVLLVGLTADVDEKVSIRVQLYPAYGETYLPPDLRLVLVSGSEKILQEVTSRSHDHYIQLKRFKSPTGKRFSIQVVLGNVSIKEDFVLEPLVG